MVIVKTKYLFSAIAIAAFLSSSMPMGSRSLEIGKEAPAITLSSTAKIDGLSSLEGKYVVVNFWSSNDPASRITNSHLAKLIKNLPQEKIRLVSVCVDGDQFISNEIMRADNLSDEALFLSINDLAPDVAVDFQISTGNRSFLMDPYNNLISISPSDQDIKAVI